jgi:hypothetical protein
MSREFSVGHFNRLIPAQCPDSRVNVNPRTEGSDQGLISTNLIPPRCAGIIEPPIAVLEVIGETYEFGCSRFG